MSLTSDTHFYSLPAHHPALPAATLKHPRKTTHEAERNGKQDNEVFHKEFVRRYTPPLYANDLLNEKTDGKWDASEAGSRWSDRLAHLIVNWWLWELLSWTMSALCVLTIAVMLGYYDGRNVPLQWPLGITLNAYIAVLSGIAKFTMAVPVEEALGQLRWYYFGTGPPKPLIDFERYDDATRGPWGAFALLVSNRGRSLASLAASIILLSLALDPFFQQLIVTPERPSMTGRSAVPRAVHFSTEHASWMDSDKVPVIGNDMYLGSVVLQFMIESTGVVPDIAPFCPSDDCSWRPFDTLGVCSQCEDISDELSFACVNESGDWKVNYTAGNPETVSCGYFFNATSAKPVLMSGYALDPTSDSHAPQEALVMRHFNLQDVNFDITYWGGSLRHKTAALPIVDFAVVAAPSVDAVYRNETPSAQECVLQWCTKRITASYLGGNYTETIISTMVNETGHDPNNFGPVTWDTNTTFIYGKNITMTPPDQNLDFFIPNMTILQTIFLFQDVIPSYVTAANESTTPIIQTHNENLYPDFKADPRLWDYPENPFAEPNNISDYVAKMATSLTNIMRTYPNSSETFAGSGSFETYIHVRWGFFTLPLALMILTLALLIGTIFSHHKERNTGLWKTSSLAMLANGIDDESRALFGPTRTLMDLFDKASKIKAKFAGANGKARLVLSSDEG